VTLGVTMGLVLGKFVGITGFSWLVLKLGVTELPKNTRFTQIAGVSLLAGIGFTMSIFVAQLGFAFPAGRSGRFHLALPGEQTGRHHR